MEKIETIHVALLDKDHLHTNGFVIKATPENANIPIEELRSRHVDLANLTVTQILFLAKEIATKVRQNSDFYLFTKLAVREILCTAVRAGRLDLNNLKDKVKFEVQNNL